MAAFFFTTYLYSYRPHIESALIIKQFFVFALA